MSFAIVGRAAVMIVVSRAARKAAMQMAVMMRKVCNFVRRAEVARSFGGAISGSTPGLMATLVGRSSDIRREVRGLSAIAYTLSESNDGPMRL